jgi:hypothetical protein
MRRYVLPLGAAMLALVAAAFAGDVWKDKPYQSWDQKDVQKILNDSPWVQIDKIVGSSGSSQTEVDTQVAAATGVNMQATGTMRPGVGEGGGTGHNDPSGTFLARWSSSRTVREALLRSDALNGITPAEFTDPAAESPENYQVVLIGTDLSAFAAAGEDSLKTTVYLKTQKTHDKILPSQVQLVKGPDGNQVAQVSIEFPKKAANGEATIASDEKGVDFIARAGKTKLSFHFNLAKMTDKQGLDL